MEEQQTLKQKLEDLTKRIDELSDEEKKQKTKKFKIPSRFRVKKSERKKNWITVLTVYENGHGSWNKMKIDDQTIMVDGVPRLATAQHVIDTGKEKIIVLPSWSVEPFTPKKHFEESMKDGSNKRGYAILLEKMKKEMISAKKPLPSWVKWIFPLVIGAIIVYAFVTGGGV